MKLILLFHPLSNGINNFILATKYKSPLLYKIIIHSIKYPENYLLNLLIYYNNLLIICWLLDILFYICIFHLITIITMY